MDSYNNIYDRPDIARSYPKCKSCNSPTWHQNIILGLCPRCMLLSPQFELEISFGATNSKNYKKAVNLAKKISGYAEEETIGLLHIIRFYNFDEYYEYKDIIAKLTLIVFKWKYFNAMLNGNKIEPNALFALNFETRKIYQ